MNRAGDFVYVLTGVTPEKDDVVLEICAISHFCHSEKRIASAGTVTHVAEELRVMLAFSCSGEVTSGAANCCPVNSYRPLVESTAHCGMLVGVVSAGNV